MAKRKEADWISVVEAARSLGVSRETIYRAIEAGRLKARLTTVTRKVWRIDPESLREFEVSPIFQQAGQRSARSRRGKSQGLTDV